jgi:hypothetical protein
MWRSETITDVGNKEQLKLDFNFLVKKLALETVNTPSGSSFIVTLKCNGTLFQTLTLTTGIQFVEYTVTATQWSGDLLLAEITQVGIRGNLSAATNDRGVKTIIYKKISSQFSEIGR